MCSSTGLSMISGRPTTIALESYPRSSPAEQRFSDTTVACSASQTGRGQQPELSFSDRSRIAIQSKPVWAATTLPRKKRISPLRHRAGSLWARPSHRASSSSSKCWKIQTPRRSNQRKTRISLRDCLKSSSPLGWSINRKETSNRKSISWRACTKLKNSYSGTPGKNRTTNSASEHMPSWSKSSNNRAKSQPSNTQRADLIAKLLPMTWVKRKSPACINRLLYPSRNSKKSFITATRKRLPFELAISCALQNRSQRGVLRWSPVCEKKPRTWQV